MHLRGRWRRLGKPPARQGTRDISPRHGLDCCRLRDRASGNWGQQDSCPGRQPLLQGSTQGDARTSVGDALLHLGAQLREEHVLGRLLCRVIEENLKERKISKKSSFSVTLWRHTKLVTSKGSPEHPGVTSPKGIFDLIMAARGSMGGENCFCSAF